MSELMLLNESLISTILEQRLLFNNWITCDL